VAIVKRGGLPRRFGCSEESLSLQKKLRKRRERVKEKPPGKTQKITVDKSKAWGVHLNQSKKERREEMGKSRRGQRSELF